MILRTVLKDRQLCRRQNDKNPYCPRSIALWNQCHWNHSTERFFAVTALTKLSNWPHLHVGGITQWRLFASVLITKSTLFQKGLTALIGILSSLIFHMSDTCCLCCSWWASVANWVSPVAFLILLLYLCTDYTVNCSLDGCISTCKFNRGYILLYEPVAPVQFAHRINIRVYVPFDSLPEKCICLFSSNFCRVLGWNIPFSWSPKVCNDICEAQILKSYLKYSHGCFEAGLLTKFAFRGTQRFLL